MGEDNDWDNAARHCGPLSRLFQDLRYAARNLIRSPAYTAAAVVVLGVGIGAATAMYAVCNAVVIQRLPIVDQDRIVVMHPLDLGGKRLPVVSRYLKEIRRDSALVRGVAGIQRAGNPFPFVYGDRIIGLTAVPVTGNYFALLGAKPALGRLINDDDAQRDSSRFIVLSFATWRREFGADSGVVGRTVFMPDWDRTLRIIGVAPPGLVYPQAADAWVPIPLNAEMTGVEIVARLQPQQSIAVARQKLLALLRRVSPFDGIKGWTLKQQFSGVEATPLDQLVLGNARPAIVVLSLAVSLLLLIACVNVGGLVLVRLGSRSREVAVRRAVGASAADLVQQFVIENAIIGTLGGLLGITVAAAALRAIIIAAPVQLPRLDALELAGTPVGIGSAATLIAMVVVATFPIFLLARIAPYSVLRADSRAGVGRTAARGRRVLVMSQVALAVVLLGGAGLLARTLSHLMSLDLGYAPGHVSILLFSSTPKIDATVQQDFELGHELLARVSAVPGVIAATPIESRPFKGANVLIEKIARADLPRAELDNAPFVPFEYVGPDYFRTFRVQIVEGRSFVATDTRSAPDVAIVSQSFAQKTWPGQDPIGMKLRRAFDTTGRVATVIGVAHDTHFRELRSATPVVYYDWDQMRPYWSGMLAVRTAPPLVAMLPSLRRAATDLSPEVRVFKAQTMDQLLDEPLAQPRLELLLLGSISAIALLLCAIGLYGVMAAVVRAQQRELGIRIALGASAGDIRRLVLTDAARIVGGGVGVGLVVALLTGRLLESQLFGVQPTDAISMAAACLALLAIALLAVYAPTRRAARVDPMEVLRAD